MTIFTFLHARSARVKGLSVSDQSDAGGKGNRHTIIIVCTQEHLHHSERSICIHIDTHVYYFMLQAMPLLNHVGVCMSYTAIWGHMLALTQEANSLTKIQSGHCILAYHIT